MTTENATINNRLQIGDETTPGTGVSADKLLENLSLSFTPKPEVKTFRGTGRRWITVAEMNREWVEMKLSGSLDYQDFLYLVCGVWGIVTPATHAGGTTSKDWVLTPAVTGAITPRTYTIEHGSAQRAHKAVYATVTGFSYKGSRKDGFTCESPLLAQAMSDGITMTSSPSAVALSPVVGSHVNLYLDSTSGGIGGTQITRAFNFEYLYDNAFGAFWPLNRSNASFTGHVDMTPKNTIKLLVEADSSGMGTYASLQAGSTVYIRFDAQGPIIESTIHYAIQHDMAVKLTNVSEFKDEDGIFAIEYEGEICEDAAWSSGQSQTMTVTNLLTAL